MEEGLANLNLLDEEEDAFHEEATVVDQNYQFCLVGLCLTDSVVHFPSLCNTMADLWHPIGGICILDLGDKRFLFQFFHDADVQIVLFGTPMFWVQIHDLPPGLMKETMAKQFGDFLGQFLEYDTSILTTEIKKFIYIRVRLDVSLLLKRKKKILIGKERTVYARFHRVDMERDNKNKNSEEEHDVGRNTMGVMEKTSLNPIFIPLEFVQHILLKGNDSWRNMGSRDLNGVVIAGEPMDLVLTEENDPLISLDGKKR
ncbi:hypothetical protein Goklo_011489 [Gossypium klotzschianum]|uniref:DUF4283 domain-containing protein n=1 Tax=Gossypium klotzschianum TaxID=34286 RepID=A0A7J8V9X9_9ROSI|nr:hypothetical protein [Gossypium klotzschianum]